jgi:RHS repeat-associated protein
VRRPSAYLFVSTASNLTWDSENRLTGVSGGATASFVYDGDTLRDRVKGTVNGVTTVYAGSHYEYNVNTSVATSYYYAGSTRVAMRQGSAVYYLFGDHLGSTSVSYRVSDGQTLTQRYYAWGGIRPGPNNALPTDYTFTGQKLDATGLMYYGARYYDSSLGRFLSADTIVPQAGNPQALNRYSYVNNNPLKYIDPSGHCWGFASGLRGTALYGATCNNMDMALTIVQSPKTSLADKTLAAGYIYVEGVYHGAAAVGAVALACSAVAPCATAVESALGIGAAACADGNCTNEIELSAKLGQNVWKMNPFDRGWAIEKAIGRSPQLVDNFPTIDRFENGVATSIKSIDLGAKTYQNIGALTSEVQGYVGKVANFNGARWGGAEITGITGRQLILAIPPNATAQQMAALQQLQAWAANQGQGVNLILQVVK